MMYILNIAKTMPPQLKLAMQWNVFINTLPATAVLIEEDTDYLAQLVTRAFSNFFPAELVKVNETHFFWNKTE